MFDAVTGASARDERDRVGERRNASRGDVRTSTERNGADRARPRPDEDGERRRAHEHGRSCEPSTRHADPRDPEHRRRDQERDHRRDAVVARVRHRSEVREPVRKQLRQRNRGEPRREQEQEEKRDPEPEQVGDVVTLDERTEDGGGIGEQLLRTTPAGDPPTSS